MIFNNTCVICQNTFEAKQRRAKFCSSRCYEKSPSRRDYQRKRGRARWHSEPEYKQRHKDHNLKFKYSSVTRYMLLRARTNAKVNGLEFNLEESDIIIPEDNICPVLGISMVMNVGSNVPNDASFSVDRIDNSKGYIKGNIAIISKRANIIKRDATLAEIEAIHNYMREQSKKHEVK